MASVWAPQSVYPPSLSWWNLISCPGLWCPSELTQRGWSHPMMWRSNPTETSDVPVCIGFWEELLYYLHQTQTSGRKELAGFEWEGGLDDLRGPFQQTFLWVCEIACSVLLKIHTFSGQSLHSSTVTEVVFCCLEPLRTFSCLEP